MRSPGGCGCLLHVLSPRWLPRLHQLPAFGVARWRPQASGTSSRRDQFLYYVLQTFDSNSGLGFMNRVKLMTAASRIAYNRWWLRSWLWSRPPRITGLPSRNLGRGRVGARPPMLSVPAGCASLDLQLLKKAKAWNEGVLSSGHLRRLRRALLCYNERVIEEDPSHCLFRSMPENTSFVFTLL